MTNQRASFAAQAPTVDLASVSCTCGTVVAIDHLSGAVTVRTDAGGHRVLDASYVADHLEHAYAPTGHGTQGATVEWAGMVGRPSVFG